MHQTYKEFLAKWLADVNRDVKERNLTREQLGEILNVKTVSAVYKLFSGDSQFSLEQYYNLNNLLNGWLERGWHYEVSMIHCSDLVVVFRCGEVTEDKVMEQFSKLNKGKLVKDPEGAYTYKGKKLFFKKVINSSL